MLEAIHLQMNAVYGDGSTMLLIQLYFCEFHTQKYLFQLFKSKVSQNKWMMYFWLSSLEL